MGHWPVALWAYSKTRIPTSFRAHPPSNPTPLCAFLLQSTLGSDQVAQPATAILTLRLTAPSSSSGRPTNVVDPTPRDFISSSPRLALSIHFISALSSSPSLFFSGSKPLGATRPLPSPSPIPTRRPRLPRRTERPPGHPPRRRPQSPPPALTAARLLVPAPIRVDSRLGHHRPVPRSASGGQPPRRRADGPRPSLRPPSPASPLPRRPALMHPRCHQWYGVPVGE